MTAGGLGTRDKTRPGHASQSEPHISLHVQLSVFTSKCVQKYHITVKFLGFECLVYTTTLYNYLHVP